MLSLTKLGMRGYRSVLVATIIVATAIITGFLRANAHPPIDIVASNWKFTPATITIEAGQEQTLRLTSSAGVHGIESDELGIKKTTITPNNFVEVTFTPKKAGTYKLYCAVICGPGHPDMLLTIAVKE